MKEIGISNGKIQNINNTKVKRRGKFLPLNYIKIKFTPTEPENADNDLIFTCQLMWIGVIMGYMLSENLVKFFTVILLLIYLFLRYFKKLSAQLIINKLLLFANIFFIISYQFQGFRLPIKIQEFRFPLPYIPFDIMFRTSIYIKEESITQVRNEFINYYIIIFLSSFILGAILRLNFQKLKLVKTIIIGTGLLYTFSIVNYFSLSYGIAYGPGEVAAYDFGCYLIEFMGVFIGSYAFILVDKLNFLKIKKQSSENYITKSK